MWARGSATSWGPRVALKSFGQLPGLGQLGTKETVESEAGRATGTTSNSHKYVLNYLNVNVTKEGL